MALLSDGILPQIDILLAFKDLSPASVIKNAETVVGSVTSISVLVPKAAIPQSLACYDKILKFHWRKIKFKFHLIGTNQTPAGTSCA